MGREAGSGRALEGIWQGIWEASGKASEASGDILEASWRHLGGIWEGIWELGWPGGLEVVLERKCANTIVFYSRKWRGRPFRLSFGGVTLTVVRYLQQKMASDLQTRPPETSKDILPSRQNPYS